MCAQSRIFAPFATALLCGGITAGEPAWSGVHAAVMSMAGYLYALRLNSPPR